MRAAALLVTRSTIGRIAMAGASRDRVGRVALPAVSRTDRGGYPALRPGAGARRARLRRGQHHGGKRRELERGEEPGEAGAQDQRAGRLDEVVDMASHVTRLSSTRAA